MRALLDSLWRAAAYCLHRRVIMLSLMPLVLMAAMTFAVAYFFWEDAQDQVRSLLDSWHMLTTLNDWLAGVGMAGLKTVLAPFVVLCLATPVVVVLSLLAVAAFMTPAMVKLVANRRFPLLERRHGGGLIASLTGSVFATVVALLVLLVSIPLWFVPPLVLVLPPLIWGWLTYRVMSYDVLAEHASPEERREVIRRHRPALLGIGVVTGYLGAAPSVVWASGMVFVVAAPLLIPVAIWIYTLVFAFSSLWFAHYALAALTALRHERRGPPPSDLQRIAAPAAAPVVDPNPPVAAPGRLLPPL